MILFFVGDVVIFGRVRVNDSLASVWILKKTRFPLILTTNMADDENNVSLTLGNHDVGMI